MDRQDRIDKYPQQIKCFDCNSFHDRDNFYYNSDGYILARLCKQHYYWRKKPRETVALIKPKHENPQLALPNMSIKDSEYHKSIDRTDTNPAFFKHLCSGADLFG